MEDTYFIDCNHDWEHKHTNWYKCSKCTVLGTKDDDGTIRELTG